MVVSDAIASNDVPLLQPRIRRYRVDIIVHRMYCRKPRYIFTNALFLHECAIFSRPRRVRYVCRVALSFSAVSLEPRQKTGASTCSRSLARPCAPRHREGLGAFSLSHMEYGVRSTSSQNAAEKNRRRCVAGAHITVH